MSNNNESNGIDPMQRLSSFKPPRDLTLGPAKNNKKVFTPNLNATRNKNKLPLVTKDQRKDDKGKKDKDRKNDKNRNNRNGPNYIKSTGIFSEGLAASERHTSRSSYGRDVDSSTPALQKPTIRVKDVIKIDKELEEQKIRSVLGDSGIVADDVPVDFRKIHERDAPIKLPVDDGGLCYRKSKSEVKIKQEVIIKSEPTDDTDCPLLNVEKTPLFGLKQETFDNTDVIDILRNSQPAMILLQLPDTLPGRGGSKDDDQPRRKANVNTEPSTSAGETTEEKMKDDKCRLTDLEEGRIGKLRLHRSGKVTLSLGETEFEVCAGTKVSFHQEVVSVAADDASRSANLISLGNVKHKLSLVPDWNKLFCDMPV